MSMTHYMELLMINSPWNLLIFMALPVVLAETIAITELVILYSRTDRPFTSALNRFCGIAAGLVFLGIAVYLVRALARRDDRRHGRPRRGGLDAAERRPRHAQRSCDARPRRARCRRCALRPRDACARRPARPCA